MDICLALGGGGIKGIAHIGVIACLEEAGYKIRAIAGSSVGGLIGAAYAAGYAPVELAQVINSLNQNSLFSRKAGDGPSLLGYTGLAQAMTDILGENTFANLKVPFACTAVDLKTSQEVYLNEGSIMEAVLASIAVPGVFPPMVRGEAVLIDGGVLDPVPVSLARLLAPKLPVIAVALNPRQEEWGSLPHFNFVPPVPFPIPPPLIEGIARMRIAQAFQIFVQSYDISSRMLTELRLEVDRPDVIIRPDVHQYGLLEPVVPDHLIAAGRLAAQEALPEIQKAMAWSNGLLRSWRRIVSGRQRRNIAEKRQGDGSGAGSAE